MQMVGDGEARHAYVSWQAHGRWHMADGTVADVWLTLSAAAIGRSAAVVCFTVYDQLQDCVHI